MAASDAGRVSALRRALLRGLVIPAHPLALTEARRLDERRQVALDAVLLRRWRRWHRRRRAHDAVRDSRSRRRPAARRCSTWRCGRCGTGAASREQRPVTIAGVCGPTAQALARSGPRGVARLRRRVAEPRAPCATRTTRPCSITAGAWPRSFRSSGSTSSRPSADASSTAPSGAGFSRSTRVVAIKVAPFDRYRTLDVVTRARRERPRATSRSIRGTTTRSWPIC